MSSPRPSPTHTSRVQHDEPGRLDAVIPPTAESFDTTEVRWFASGALPGQFVDWFSASGTTAFTESRCDTYWVDGQHSTGLKRRGDGPFEVKLRRDSTGFIDLGSGVGGRIEEWRKIRPVEPRFARLRRGEWWEVHKVVLTRTYGVRSTGGVGPLNDRDLDVPGCDVELASVGVAGADAWTFAFEAWGPADERRTILDQALASLRQSSPIPTALLLRLEYDIGYPEWLALTVGPSQPDS